MTINEFQKEALRTVKDDSKNTILIEGLMGMSSESGEALDILKKFLFQGHELDKEHLKEELGDVAWYLAVSAYAIGCDLEDILVKNIEKLHGRYPEGFDADRSVNR